VKALLVDLYETLVWTDWQALGHMMTARLNVDGPTLLRAFEATSIGRGTGQYGSIRGDLAAIIAATAAAPPAGGSADAGARPSPDVRAADQVWLEALEIELNAFLREHTHVYPDVRPVLRKLRDAGTRVAIVSNCDHATGPLLEGLGLSGDVDATVLSFAVRSIKPDAAIFEHALACLGVSGDDAIFVDDQPRFLDGARAVGIRTLQIARTPGYLPDSGAEEHPVIADLNALVP
jgi:HAD superfamily hydrolase (TIGR01509 family)